MKDLYFGPIIRDYLKFKLNRLFVLARGESKVLNFFLTKFKFTSSQLAFSEVSSLWNELICESLLEILSFEFLLGDINFLILTCLSYLIRCQNYLLYTFNTPKNYKFISTFQFISSFFICLNICYKIDHPTYSHSPKLFKHYTLFRSLAIFCFVIIGVIFNCGMSSPYTN